jgi:cytochrome d ubiquinol oxidase subunit I
MEGLWRTTRSAPAAVRDSDGAARENHFEIALPKLASLILRHDLDAEIQGLDDFRDRHPPVFAVFWAFRVMVGIGVLMLVTSWLGWWLCRRSGWAADRLPRPLLWWLAAMTFSGWVAVVAGWYTGTDEQSAAVHRLACCAPPASRRASSPRR